MQIFARYTMMEVAGHAMGEEIEGIEFIINVGLNTFIEESIFLS